MHDLTFTLSAVHKDLAGSWLQLTDIKLTLYTVGYASKLTSFTKDTASNGHAVLSLLMCFALFTVSYA